LNMSWRPLKRERRGGCTQGPLKVYKGFGKGKKLSERVRRGKKQTSSKKIKVKEKHETYGNFSRPEKGGKGRRKK